MFSGMIVVGLLGAFLISHFDVEENGEQVDAQTQFAR